MPKENLEKLRRGAIDTVQARLDNREPQLDRLPGILGKTNTQGSATVPGKPGWCYARVGNDETIVIAFNNRTSHRNGLPVIVGYDAAQPQLFQVLSVRQVYDDGTTVGGQTGKHAPSHQWGDADGDDIPYLRMRQINDCRVYATDPASLLVNIADGVYCVGQVIYYYGGGTLDLTASVPGSGMRWVLIAMSESGPYAVNGTAAGSVALTDIPVATKLSDYRLAAVLLKKGDTEITDWPDTICILDLRLTGSRSYAGGGGYTGWDNTIIVAKSGGDYDTVDAGADAAVSGDSVRVMPGSYAENVTCVTYGISIGGWEARMYSGPHGPYVVGADDVGPIVDVDAACILYNMVVNRAATTAAAEFHGVKAEAPATSIHLIDMRVDVSTVATGEECTAVELGAGVGYTSFIDRCWLRAAGTGTINAVKIPTGIGAVHILRSELTGDVLIEGTGTLVIKDCIITGDVLASGNATVEIYDTYVSGDITGGGGTSTVKLVNVSCPGTIGTWQSVTADVMTNTITEATADTGVAVEGCIFENGTALIGEAGLAQVSDEVLTVYRDGANGQYQVWDDNSQSFALGQSGGYWIFTANEGTCPSLIIDGEFGWIMVDPANVMDPAGPVGTFSIVLYDAGGSDSFLVYDVNEDVIFEVLSDGKVGIGLRGATIAHDFIVHGVTTASPTVAIGTPGLAATDQALLEWITKGSPVTLGNAAATGWHVVGRGDAYASDANDLIFYSWDGTDWGRVLHLDNATDYVGITVAPSYPLHIQDVNDSAAITLRVDKDITSKAAQTAGVYVSVDGTNSSPNIGVFVASVTGGSANYGLYIASGYNYLADRTAIGTSVSASYKLYVYHNTTGQYAMCVNQDHASGYGLFVTSDGTLAALRVECGTVANLIRADQSGVGINIAGSDTWLQIAVTGNGQGIHCDNAFMGRGTYGANYAQFGHWDFKASAGYGYLQSNVGKVYLSAPTGQTVDLLINNAAKLSVSAAAVWVIDDLNVKSGLHVGATGVAVTKGVIQGTVGTSSYLPMSAYAHLPASQTTNPSYPFAGTVQRSITLKTFAMSIYVATTNNATHYWIFRLKRSDGTIISTLTTSGNAPNAWVHEANSISYAIGTAQHGVYVEAVKNNSPGAYSAMCPAIYFI